MHALAHAIFFTAVFLSREFLICLFAHLDGCYTAVIIGEKNHLFQPSHRDRERERKRNLCVRWTFSRQEQMCRDLFIVVTSTICLHALLGVATSTFANWKLKCRQCESTLGVPYVCVFVVAAIYAHKCYIKTCPIILLHWNQRVRT